MTHPQIINQKTLKNLEKITPHLQDKIDDLKKSGEWKLHLTMKLKYMSSRGSNQKRTMYSKSGSSLVKGGTGTDKIIQELFD